MILDSGKGRFAIDGAYVKPTLGSGPFEGAVYVVDGSSFPTSAAVSGVVTAVGPIRQVVASDAPSLRITHDQNASGLPLGKPLNWGLRGQDLNL